MLAETPPAPRPSVWPGFVATLLWGAAAFVFYFLIQGLVIAVASSRHAGIGFSFWVATVVAAPFGALFLLLAAERSAPDSSAAERLGLRLPTGRQALLSVAAVSAFNLGYDQLSHWLGRPIVPSFMAEVYRSAHGLPGLYLAIVVAAPVFEELLFRGFMIPGLRPALGAVGAALFSSAAFALPHLQYDLFDMSCVFLLGLLFAAVRLKTGSTLLTVGLHALTNLIATLQTAWVLAHPH